MAPKAAYLLLPGSSSASLLATGWNIQHSALSSWCCSLLHTYFAPIAVLGAKDTGDPRQTRSPSPPPMESVSYYPEYVTWLGGT